MNPHLAFHEVLHRNHGNWNIYPAKQEIQKDDLNRYAARFNMPSEELCIDFDAYRRQWLHEHWARGSQILELTTCSSLAADVSSTTIYENAGLPLDFLRGYVRLRGKAVKGLAETFAVTVWFPSQYARIPGTIDPEPADEGSMKKAEYAWEQIERIFGWAPDSHHVAKDFVPECILEQFNRRRQKQAASRGKICFSSAMPRQLTVGDQDDGTPRLKVEIINSHHRDYYRGEGWPGDWEDPVPNYFLAVRPGAIFQFPLSKLGPEVEQRDVELAQEWLVGGLTKLGFGAKTGVGYGRFQAEAKRYTFAKCDGAEYAFELCLEERNTNVEPKSDSEVDMLRPKELKELQELLPGVTIRQQGMRLVLEADMKLLSPAFIAGANQTALQWQAYLEGRDQSLLNEQELSEMLHNLAVNDRHVIGKAFKAGMRSWWRTMHAGYLEKSQFLQLEDEIFGSTKTGQRVQVSIKPMDISIKRFDFRNQKLTYDQRAEKWRRSERGVLRENRNIAGLTPINKYEHPRTIQGLFYASYGMDEDTTIDMGRNGEPKEDQTSYPRSQRYFFDEGSTFRVSIVLPPISRSPKKPEHEAVFARQVVFALVLFSTFGGIGSRARKGFGSFQYGNICTNTPLNLKILCSQAKSDAKNLREIKQMNNSWEDHFWNSASIEKVVGPCELDVGFKSSQESAMAAIDHVNLVYQKFCKDMKHRLSKAGLGLPRTDINYLSRGIKKLLHNDYEIDEDGKIKFAKELGTPSDDVLRNKISRFSSPVHLRYWESKSEKNQKSQSIIFIAFIDRNMPYERAQTAYPTTSMQLLSALKGYFEDIRQSEGIRVFEDEESQSANSSTANAASASPAISTGEVLTAKLITDPKFARGKIPKARPYIRTLTEVDSKIREAKLSPHAEDRYLPDPIEDVGKQIAVVVTKINKNDIEFCVCKGARAVSVPITE